MRRVLIWILIMGNIWRICFAALCALCFYAQATAQEVITEFDVAMSVAENGDYKVVETISVNVRGQKIRRGIFRDLPRYYIADGIRLPFRYRVESVTRNGKRERYEKNRNGNAYQIRIGDPDVFLQHGPHEYKLTYIVKDEIGREADGDYVYWNVTGTYWDFPIEKARIRLSMPSGAQLLQSEYFTGKFGETGSDARLMHRGNDYVIETTRRLERREGITVRLKFAKGAIGPVQAGTKRFLWWARYGALLILTGSLFGMGIYYLRNWNRVGRDPAKPPVFARYEPPEGYSAAAVSRIHYNGISGYKPFVATLLSLAIKEYIAIDAGKKKTVIDILDTGTAPLDAEEQFLWKQLSSRSFGDKITLQRGKPHMAFNMAKDRFMRHVGEAYSVKYFRWNGKYIAMGIILSVLATAFGVSQYYKGAFEGMGWLIFAMVSLNVLFFILIPAPTVLGQTRRAEIEGFRLYMKTAEKGRLNTANPEGKLPPAMNVEEYERMLPYAVALGVEEPWGEYFEQAMPEAAQDYNPGWSGMNRSDFNSLGQLTDSMVSNMSSGVSSAAPQSSGSSSGGGSSGGGGGGGGGGGW